jgi:hypothetical protein
LISKRLLSLLLLIVAVLLKRGKFRYNEKIRGTYPR